MRQRWPRRCANGASPAPDWTCSSRSRPILAHPLLNMDNVIASPHIAGMTVETMTEMCEATALQWLTIFDGGVPPRLVNPEVWPRYAERSRSCWDFAPTQPTTQPA